MKTDILFRVLENAHYLRQFLSRFETDRRLEGMTLRQEQLLHILEQYPGETVQSSAARLTMSPSAMAQMLGRMASRGWIVRSTDPEDRRRVHLSLTRKGVATLKHLKEHRVSKIRAFLGGVRESDLVDLARIQERIIARLNQPAGSSS